MSSFWDSLLRVDFERTEAASAAAAAAAVLAVGLIIGAVIRSLQPATHVRETLTIHSTHAHAGWLTG